MRKTPDNIEPMPQPQSTNCDQNTADSPDSKGEPSTAHRLLAPGLVLWAGPRSQGAASLGPLRVPANFWLKRVSAQQRTSFKKQNYHNFQLIYKLQIWTRQKRPLIWHWSWLRLSRPDKRKNILPKQSSETTRWNFSCGVSWIRPCVVAALASKLNVPRDSRTRSELSRAQLFFK